jgi:hypothetical protein
LRNQQETPPTSIYPPTARAAIDLKTVASFLIILGAFIVLLVVIGPLIAQSAERARRQRLETYGVSTSARVVHHSSIGHGTDRATYEFTVVLPQGGARVYSGTCLVGADQIPVSLMVVYDPQNPANVQTESELSRPMPDSWGCVFLFPGIVFILGGTAMYRYGRAAGAQAEKLDREGVTARAVVTARGTLDRSRHPYATFSFEVPASGGAPGTVVASEVINLVTRDQQLQVGAEITVRYLPSDPSICRIEHIDRASHS